MPRPTSSPDWISRTLQVPGDSTPLIKRPGNKGTHNGRDIQVDPTPKNAQSFFARLKTFVIGLFRGNRSLQLQLSVTPIATKIIPVKWTEIERQWLEKFGEKRINIFLDFAKEYLEKFPDAELQKLMPAVIKNYKEDFNQKCYQLRSAATFQESPMSHMLYQAHWKTSPRSDCNFACVKKFAKFMNQRDTSKAFASLLGSDTRMKKPKPPNVQSICDVLKGSDAITVKKFLFVSDEALLCAIEDEAGYFSAVSEADPSLSSSKAMHAALQEDYLDVFCTEFKRYRKLDLNCLPLIDIHIYLAHHAAVAKALKLLPGLLGSRAFPCMEHHIGKSGILSPDVKRSSQIWASKYP